MARILDVWAKIGTHPAFRYQLFESPKRRLRSFPKVGDEFTVRDLQSKEWIPVRLLEIRQVSGSNLYVCERF